MKAARRYWLGIVDDISQRERIVVTDANVLINLIQVDRLDLLGALPGLGFIRAVRWIRNHCARASPSTCC